MMFYIFDFVERYVIVIYIDIGDLIGVKVKFVCGDGVKVIGLEYEVWVWYVIVEFIENI